jgi:TolA-binding protein
VNVDLKDGSQVAALGLRVADQALLVTQQLANGPGEIGYPLANVQKIEFPEPTQLATAATLLQQGRAADALAQAEPVATYYSGLRTVPGNFYLPAMLLKLDALAALKREPQIDAAIQDLASTPNNPAAIEAARVRNAEAAVRRGVPAQAEPVFDEYIKNGTTADTLAHAWFGKGQILMARADFEPALLAYLHVPALYPDIKVLMPPALLGGARAFAGIDNLDRAKETYQRVIAEFPASPEATDARAELQKLQKRTATASH